MKIKSYNDLVGEVQNLICQGMASDLQQCMEGEPLTAECLAECAIDTLYDDFDKDFDVNPKMIKKLEKSLTYYVN
jgi:hypothetical protein